MLDSLQMKSEMLKIDLDINYTTTLNLNFHPSHMEYDPLSQEVLMSEGINFRIMDHELNQVKRSVNLPSAIFKHYAHYSR